MTKQEMFDKSAKHLLTQMQVCEDGYGTCLYRGEDGLKCAAGIFIPESLYSPKLEERTISGALDQEPRLKEYFIPTDAKASGYELMDSLQHIHDCGTPESWPERLRDLAREENLDDKVLNAF